MTPARNTTANGKPNRKRTWVAPTVPSVLISSRWAALRMVCDAAATIVKTAHKRSGDHGRSGEREENGGGQHRGLRSEAAPSRDGDRELQGPADGTGPASQTRRTPARAGASTPPAVKRSIGRDHLGAVERLAEMVVHAGGEALGDVLGEDAGGQRDDRQFGEAAAAARGCAASPPARPCRASACPSGRCRRSRVSSSVESRRRRCRRPAPRSRHARGRCGRSPGSCGRRRPEGRGCPRDGAAPRGRAGGAAGAAAARTSRTVNQKVEP